MKKNNLNSDVLSKGKAKNDYHINQHARSFNALNLGLSRDTMILIEDVSLKRIDSIVAGDIILGEEGKTMSVSLVYTEYEDYLWKIRVNDSTHFLSENTPIKTCNGILPANELKAGMKVCFVNGETRVIDTVDLVCYNDVIYGLSLDCECQLIVANGFIVGGEFT